MLRGEQKKCKGGGQVFCKVHKGWRDAAPNSVNLAYAFYYKFTVYTVEHMHNMYTYINKTLYAYLHNHDLGIYLPPCCRERRPFLIKKLLCTDQWPHTRHSDHWQCERSIIYLHIVSNWTVIIIIFFLIFICSMILWSSC